MLNGWWVATWYQADPLTLYSWVFWVIVSITLHELGHGIAAIRCGDDTPRLLGHMTLNPLVHIPGQAWILFLLTGMTWGRMPVNPSRFRRTIDDAIVSGAGPAVNLILAILCVVFGGLWAGLAKGHVDSLIYHNVVVFLRVGAAMNIFAVPFNLIPVPPLDGSRILAAFSRPYRELISSPQAMGVSMLILALMMIFIGRLLYPAAFLAADVGIGLIGGVLRAIVS